MKFVKDIKKRFYFYKEKKTDKIWWVDFVDYDGLFAISFDKKRFYSFLRIVHKIFLQKNLKFSKKNSLIGQNFFT